MEIYNSKVIISKKEIDEVKKVLNSGLIAQGRRVLELESELAKLCGTKYAIAVNSGTAALHTALVSAGVGTGDEVITTPFTFVATANSILMAGAKPVFADIREDTFNIDPDMIERAITKKTKAIIVVNLYGQPAEYKKINSIAKKHNLIVIEDAAQSIGAEYMGKPSGSLGDIGCFSFYATKNIMCGEGGMITTNNKVYTERARLFRHHGQDEKKKYEYTGLGYNYRMTDISATIALGQLKKIDEFTNKRIRNAKILSKGLMGIKGIVVPLVSDESKHVFHQYTLRITKDFKISRDKLKDYLSGNGIYSGIFYPKPLYLYEHLKCTKAEINNMPIVKRVSGEVLSLPVHPFIKISDINYIVAKILNL